MSKQGTHLAAATHCTAILSRCAGFQCPAVQECSSCFTEDASKHEPACSLLHVVVRAKLNRSSVRARLVSAKLPGILRALYKLLCFLCRWMSSGLVPCWSLSGSLHRHWPWTASVSRYLCSRPWGRAFSRYYIGATAEPRSQLTLAGCKHDCTATQQMLQPFEVQSSTCRLPSGVVRGLLASSSSAHQL